MLPENSEISSIKMDLRVLETNMSHLVGTVSELSDGFKSMQRLMLEESRNKQSIEVLERDKKEMKAEIDEIRADIKAIRESVTNNSFVSRAIIAISGIVAGAVVTAVVNLWLK